MKIHKLSLVVQKVNFLFIIILFINFALLFHAHAADVTAPSKDNIYTLTVNNIGEVDISGTVVSASLTRNPDGLITIKSVTPSTANISAGGSQAFSIKFDVGCPPEGSSKTETAKIKFTITKSTTGPFYIKNCGINPTTCTELEAEFTVQEELDKCHTCDCSTFAIEENCDCDFS